MARRVAVPDDLDAPGLPEAPDYVDAYAARWAGPWSTSSPTRSSSARSLATVAERLAAP